MKVGRRVSAVGLVVALAVGAWQVAWNLDGPLSALLFAGLATGFFLIGLLAPTQVSPRRRTLLINLGVLALILCGLSEGLASLLAAGG